MSRTDDELWAAAADGDEVRRLLWELAVEAAGIGTFDWDLVSGRLVWDARLVELFGDGADSFDESIDAFYARVHPEDRDRVARDLRAAIDTLGLFDAEFRLLLPDGSIRWIGARGRAVGPAGGAAIRLLGAASDITARRAAEARVASVVESMGTAFFSLGADWRFTYVNAEAERLLDRPREELVGAVVWEAFPAAVGSEFETNYRTAMQGDDPVAFDAYYPPPLDAWYEVRAWRDQDGLAVYFLGVTARRRLQEQAERAAARAALPARITEQLIGTLDHSEAAQRLAELAVPTLADWCVVTLVDDRAHVGTRRGLRNVVARHRDPDLQATVDDYARLRLAELRDDSLVVAAVESEQRPHLRRGATAAVQAMLGPGRARTLLGRLARSRCSCCR